MQFLSYRSFRVVPRFFPAALATGALLTCTQVRAQTESVVSEKDFLSDMPIVLSVSRLPQRLDETPGAVTILDHDMIRHSGARDVADLLRLVPGFQVSDSFESVAPLVSYHGAFDSYSNRLEVRIDGRSVYSPYFIGSIGPGLESVALEDIDHIEVLRGSNSAAFGAHAILGVINIVTRDTADTLGPQGAVTVGENGVRDTQARIGWGSLGQTLRLTADTRADDGLKGADGQNRVSRVNFRSDLRPNGVDEVQVRLGAMSIDSGKGLLGNVNNPWRDFSFDSSYAQVDWRRTLGQDADLALSLSHSQETYRDSFPFLLQNLSSYFSPNDIYTVSADGKASSDAMSLQYTWRASPTVRTVLGGEFRSERVQSPGLYNTDATFVTDFTRLFGNVEWRATPTLLINAGAMAERDSVSGDTLSPRLMANWHMTDGQTLRVGVSKAVRPPSTYENFANIQFIYQGNRLGWATYATGNLQPEKVLSREIGYLGEFPHAGISLDARAFHEQVDQPILHVNSVSPSDYVNDAGFAIHGIECQLKWQPWQGGQLILNQAYTRIDAPHLVTTLASPRQATTVAYMQQLPGQMDLTLIHGAVGGANSYVSEENTVPMTRTDLRLAKALHWGTHRGEIALVVQNLGSPYADYRSIFLFQRQAFVTLRLDD
ncbi:TonB-dependent receptor domain-containing protein [Rhodoferax sp.]|uniref:TonB-dependent receptor plug domain-containing protein n=1 Tax=Rhodoferax sp. TaxID=50421 RepID=UPI0028514C40|nr:TonB-dependent receptor [Rhodoferax sp.]MDR3369620.1 TonB-dependent receptor [Rhodoferax sp.]